MKPEFELERCPDTGLAIIKRRWEKLSIYCGDFELDAKAASSIKTPFVYEWRSRVGKGLINRDMEIVNIDYDSDGNIKVELRLDREPNFIVTRCSTEFIKDINPVSIMLLEKKAINHIGKAERAEKRVEEFNNQYEEFGDW